MKSFSKTDVMKEVSEVTGYFVCFVVIRPKAIVSVRSNTTVGLHLD